MNDFKCFQVFFVIKTSSLSGRESRAIKHESKDVFDDANDFNDDDFSLIDSLAKQEGKGNLTDEAIFSTDNL